MKSTDTPIISDDDIPLISKRLNKEQYNYRPTEDSDEKKRNQQHITWRTILLVCSIIYIIPELIFNVSLVEVAGGTAFDDDTFRYVELFGRAISGVGASLLLIDLIFSKARFSSLKSALISSIIIFLIFWPLVFFGQRMLIDQYIINPSSADARQDAFILQLVRKALVANTVKVEGVSYDPNSILNPQDKTFLTLFAGVAWYEGSLVRQLDQQKDNIIRKYLSDTAFRNFDKHYQDYNSIKNEIKSQYSDYAKNSNLYNEALDSWQLEADKYWLTVENEIQSGWKKLRKAQAEFDDHIDLRAQEIAPRMYEFFESRNKCSDIKSNNHRDRCYRHHTQRYNREIKSYNIGYIPEDDFLVKTAVSKRENITNSLLMGLLTGGATVALQALDKVTGGDGGFREYRYSYTNNVDHYKKILRKRMAPKFVRESGGYQLYLTELKDFKEHEVTNKKLRSELSKKGLNLPTDWKSNDRLTFDNQVKELVHDETKRKWKIESERQSSELPPNISWKEFQLLDVIQSKISSKMGDLYVKPVLASWNNKQFKERLLEPNIDRKTEEYLAIVNSQSVSFNDGEKYDNHGRSALRATVIPPISMTLSLFLVIMTIIKLPIKVRQILLLKRQHKTNNNYHISKFTATYYTATLITFLTIPLMISNYKFNDSNTILSYYSSKIKESNNYVIGYTIDWATSAQPIISHSVINLKIDSVL